MSLEAANNQMMPDNGYMNYPMQRPDMPSTSNSQAMQNFSMDDIHQQNSVTPPMMHQQSQGGLANYSQPPPVSGYQQQVAYQNQYGGMNSAPPSSQPVFNNNGNMYFQQHQQNGNNSRMNTPNYGGNTPSYPPQVPTSAFNQTNGFMPGQHGGMMQQQQFHGNVSGHPTPTYPNAPGSIQQPRSHQDVGDNGDPHMYMLQQQQAQQQEIMCQMRLQQQQAQQQQQQQAQQQASQFPPQQQRMQKRTLCFNSEMLNQMTKSVVSREVESPHVWHQGFEQSHCQNRDVKQTNSKKRKLSSSSSPMYNGNMQKQQPDYSQQAAMSEFQSQPMSMSSNPSSVHDPIAGPSMNGMIQKPAYMKQDNKKDDDDPLRGMERMANQTLDSTSTKVYSQRNDSKRQEDKNMKLAKLNSIASNLNLQAPDYSQNMNMNMRIVAPIGMPENSPMPPNMMMNPNMRYFPPNFDPNTMRPGMIPPGAMGYPPNSGMMSPAMNPLQPSPVPQNMMQPPPYGVPGAPSPKYHQNMMNRPPFNPSDPMHRPQMTAEMQQMYMHQQRMQMMKHHEVAAGAGGMYNQ